MATTQQKAAVGVAAVAALAIGVGLLARAKRAERKLATCCPAGAPPRDDLVGKFPEIEPYNKGFLKVSDLHTLYYEEAGNPAGKPVVVLHGGPGGGSQPSLRQYFDPKVWRVIQFDQRGAGQSTPSACLEHNTTWDLVADIEKLREFLKVDRWVVWGGSWGSTLSLTYAQTHPTKVKALVLRGIFLVRRKELLYFYQDGTSFIWPDAFAPFRDFIPEGERNDLISAYHRRLTGDDEKVRLEAAKRWSTWEMMTSRLVPDPVLVKRAEKDEWALQFARIESHYFVNGGFFKTDGQLLDNMASIAHIPGTIVQGRYDVVCPAKSAWELKEKWPGADLKFVGDAGHSAAEPGTISELVKAMDKYKHL